MVFDEDTTLLSFFERYKVPEQIEELKRDVLKYIGAGVTEKVPTEDQSTNDGSLDAVSLFLTDTFLDVITHGFSSRHEKETKVNGYEGEARG